MLSGFELYPRWMPLTSQNSKTLALVGPWFVTLRSDFNNLEVSFNSYLTFLQKNVIKMFTVQ